MAAAAALLNYGFIPSGGAASLTHSLHILS